MSKLIFLPLRLVAGLLSGIVAKKLFQRLWAVLDEEPPPKAENRRSGIAKLALSLFLEAGLSRAIRGLAEHGSRRAFASFTGTWPGEEDPDPE